MFGYLSREERDRQRLDNTRLNALYAAQQLSPRSVHELLRTAAFIELYLRGFPLPQAHDC